MEQPSQGNVFPEPPPKNWLVESILVTIFCCLPFGIVGIVNAAQVNSRVAAGDLTGAARASREAGKWTKIGFFCGMAFIVLYFIAIFFFGATAFWASRHNYHYQVSIFRNRTVIITAFTLLLLCFLFDAQTGLFQCPFHAITHFDCPGGGLQRSILLLLHGEVKESLKMYWATVPILIMFAYCLLFLKYRYRNGLRILVYFFSFNAVLIFFNYIFKLTHYL